MGPNLTNITRVLTRIEEINRQLMPDMYQQASPMKSRFVDVLNDVERARKVSRRTSSISGKTSYDELKDIIDECAEKYNIDNELIRAIADLVRKTPTATPTTDTRKIIELPARKISRKSREPVKIIRQSDGSFRVEHENFEKSVARINFEHEDALQKFARLLKALSVEEALEAAGAREGDKVYIGEVEFDFEPDSVT
mgnify:CR=1 FL=1